MRPNRSCRITVSAGVSLGSAYIGIRICPDGIIDRVKDVVKRRDKSCFITIVGEEAYVYGNCDAEVLDAVKYAGYMVKR